MSERFTTEMLLRIYSDEDGYYWTVGYDADSLGCVRVTYSDGGKNDAERECFTVPPIAARLIADAMVKIADDLEKPGDA